MAEMIENKMATKHVEAVADYNEDTAHRGQLLFDEERHLGVLATAKLHHRALLTCKSGQIIVYHILKLCLGCTLLQNIQKLI
jgi:hypothetical protein